MVVVGEMEAGKSKGDTQLGEGGCLCSSRGSKERLTEVGKSHSLPVSEEDWEALEVDVLRCTP